MNTTNTQIALAEEMIAEMKKAMTAENKRRTYHTRLMVKMKQDVKKQERKKESLTEDWRAFSDEPEPSTSSEEPMNQ